MKSLIDQQNQAFHEMKKMKQLQKVMTRELVKYRKTSAKAKKILLLQLKEQHFKYKKILRALLKKMKKFHKILTSKKVRIYIQSMHLCSFKTMYFFFTPLHFVSSFWMNKFECVMSAINKWENQIMDVLWDNVTFIWYDHCKWIQVHLRYLISLLYDGIYGCMCQ